MLCEVIYGGYYSLSWTSHHWMSLCQPEYLSSFIRCSSTAFEPWCWSRHAITLLVFCADVLHSLRKQVVRVYWMVHCSAGMTRARSWCSTYVQPAHAFHLQKVSLRSSLWLRGVWLAESCKKIMNHWHMSRSANITSLLWDIKSFEIITYNSLEPLTF